MCHLAAWDQREAGCGGKSENFFERFAGYFFYYARGRAACGVAGVLVPGGSEPVCRQRGGERTSDDPAVETASGGCDQTRLLYRGLGWRLLARARRLSRKVPCLYENAELGRRRLRLPGFVRDWLGGTENALTLRSAVW